MRPFDPRLLRRARATGGFLALTVVIGTLLAGTVLAQAVVLAHVLAPVVLGRADLGDVSGLLTVLLGVVALRAVLLWAQDVASARASAQVRSQLRSALLRHVVALGPGWLGGQASGELAQVAARGVDALDGYFARYLPQLVLTVLVPTAVLVTMAWADPLSAVVVLVTLPLIPFFLALVGMTTQVAQRRQWQALERLGHHFLDVVAPGTAGAPLPRRGRPWNGWGTTSSPWSPGWPRCGCSAAGPRRPAASPTSPTTTACAP
ncbi:ABC transporter transmembrane domain-containing protein [Aquipuribacter sp. MA13-6]|uniref:ABC transporter transmembrane domain-containing protein n=1 Tax=Aquipuribacter sp. MA13-6 TaxID=3440839 RepID=UPI003EF038E0